MFGADFIFLHLMGENLTFSDQLFVSFLLYHWNFWSNLLVNRFHMMLGCFCRILGIRYRNFTCCKIDAIFFGCFPILFLNGWSYIINTLIICMIWDKLWLKLIQTRLGWLWFTLLCDSFIFFFTFTTHLSKCYHVPQLLKSVCLFVRSIIVNLV